MSESSSVRVRSSERAVWDHPYGSGINNWNRAITERMRERLREERDCLVPVRRNISALVLLLGGLIL